MEKDRQYTVLIVDDNPEDRDAVRRYLTRDVEEQYALLEADNGEDALKVYQHARPDCVLLDFHLPDMNGLEFVAELVYELDTHLVPVVMLTGTGNEVIAVEAMKNGVQDYLVKGRASADDLRRAVRNAVERVEMQRRLEEQRAQLEQKNRELELANRRKDQFLAMLAHELRNPLAPILNGLHVQRLKNDDRETAVRVRQIVDRQVRHLARLTDDLLDVARITRGKILLRRERLELCALVRETVEDQRCTLERQKLDLRLYVPEGPVWINGDRTRISQVLSNFLSNSIKFTDAGGQIAVRLTARPDGRRVSVSVRDSGIGMDHDMLAHVFETFSQADESLDRSQGGLGLGLALAKGLIDLHGGEVRAYSAGPGQGSEFSFVLPLDSGQPGAAPAAPAEQPQPGGGDGMRILVVEDNRDSADTLAELLELWGHDVCVARSGPGGIDAALANPPEVILLDIGLPGMDGFEVARRVRQEPALEGTLLVALTGYGQDEDRHRSLAAGFDEHVVKPVDPHVLRAVIAGAARRCPAPATDV